MTKTLKITTVDFDKPIQIASWGNGCEICEVPAEEGLAMMGRSKRWDTEHTTANVRELCEFDRNILNERFGMDLCENFPVTFHQR